MKASELRIGNLISWNSSGDIEKVMKIDLKYVNDVYEKDLSPIQLTEEWLLKFGFKEDGPDWYFMSTKDRFTDIGYSYSIKKNIFEVNEWEMIEVKYIHQLQNLYFALTGLELETN